MNYRGNDIDLRSPPPTSAGRWSHAVADGGGPFYVDDVVLACCNHAYDLALAQRSPEVRLEHLLNAMTRTDAASGVMEQSGINVPALRHETAGLIAFEGTQATSGARTAPRRSADIEDALRRASAYAYPRRSPVMIADLLNALLEMNRELSGVAMLKRHASGWSQYPNAEAIRGEPLPPLSGAYVPDPRYAGLRGDEQPRDWVRAAAPTGYYAAPTPQYYAPEPQRAAPQPSYYLPEPGPAAPANNLADAVQNNRLDQMERTIRELSSELSNERKAFSQLVGELQRDVVSQNDTTNRFRGGLDDRLASLEQTLMAARTDGGPAAERLSNLERSVDAKFADLARGWTALGERLQSLEQVIVAGREIALPANMLAKLQSVDDVARSIGTMTDLLANLEEHVTSGAARTTVDLAPVIDRLAALERTIGNRPQPQPVDLTSVHERLAALDRKLEDGATAQRHQIGQLASTLTAEVKAVSSTLAGQSGTGDRIQALVNDRLQGMTTALERQRAEITTAVAAPLRERMTEITVLADKMAVIEKSLQGFGHRTVELHAAQGQDLVEVHDALVKLNTNQQTLAVSLDQWRLDNSTELGALSARVDQIDRAGQRPVQMLETLQASVQGLHKASMKRDEQRSRFRTWLMGTDDWYGASWEHGGAAQTGHKPIPSSVAAGTMNGRTNGQPPGRSG